MLKPLLTVGIGSFIGGILRYWISTLMNNSTTSTFPWGTLIVNLTGCLLIGIFYGFFERYNASSSSWCLLLTTGFCGGFTTFSTFSRESLTMLQSSNYGALITYITVSLLLGIALAAAGWQIHKLI